MFNKNNLIFILFFVSFGASADVITCEDVTLVNSSEAKKELHKQAQKRAQKKVEQFVGKKLINPYIDMGFVGMHKTLDTTIPMIEIYWCDYPKMPLHSAYYGLYTSDHLNRLKFFGE